MLLQSQSPSLRHLTTAHLAQTMALLELTAYELSQKIETELAGNPALELVDTARCPSCHRPVVRGAGCPVCTRLPRQVECEPVVFISPQSDFSTLRRAEDYDARDANEWTAAVEDLPTYVLRQVKPDLEDELDRLLAAHILTSLDDDGLLPTPLIEIARYHHVPLARVAQVQRIIQRADPLGVGSNTVQQALAIQLEFLAECGPLPAHVECAIAEGYELLTHQAFPELARVLGVTVNHVQQLARFIGDNLNPYPARAHYGDIHQAPSPRQITQSPDILITCLNDEPACPLMVEIISPYAGALRVNPLFKNALEEAPDDKQEQWQADLDRAGLLVKCIQQRDHTLVRLMQRMVVLQRRYLLEGDAYLLPITRAQLADELGVHESTISRAVSEKLILLPNRRMVPFARLFDRSLHIRTALREIVAHEAHPLTDTEIANLLLRQGYPVARRTVAKYRAMEDIQPARLRQISLAQDHA